MAYSVMIKKGEELVKLDISNLPTFERLSKYKDSKTYSLEEIDLCTSKYENIMHLKKDLDCYKSSFYDELHHILSDELR